MNTKTEALSQFEKDLQSLINRHSQENGSNTPDFILANYLNSCLENFNRVVQAREKWYGRSPEPVRASEEPGCQTCRPFWGRPWKNSEYLDIVFGFIEGKTLYDIARALYRPIPEVQMKVMEIDVAIAKLNISNPTKPVLNPNVTPVTAEQLNAKCDRCGHVLSYNRSGRSNWSAYCHPCCHTNRATRSGEKNSPEEAAKEFNAQFSNPAPRADAKSLSAPRNPVSGMRDESASPAPSKGDVS